MAARGKGNPYGQCRICKIKWASKEGYCGPCKEKLYADEMPMRRDREQFIERHSRYGRPQRNRDIFTIEKSKFDMEREKF